METQPITLSLSDQNLHELDEICLYIRKPSGLKQSRSGAARLAITIGAKVLQISRFQKNLLVGSELSELLKELSTVSNVTKLH